MKKSKVYLIPSFIGNSNYAENFPNVNIDLINEVDVFIAERAKTARAFLKSINYQKPFEETQIIEISKHENQDWITLLAPIVINNKVIGILSEAGSPCIADPGFEIVKILQQLKAEIIPLIGPSSIFLALSASGLSGQSFSFHGYLPIDRKEKQKKIKQLEMHAFSGYAQIFMETPYRNLQLFDELLKTCNPNTLLCLACDLLTENQFILTKSIAEWQKFKPDLNKKPTIFILGK